MVYYFEIKRDTTTRDKWYCVMQNPFKDTRDTKVIFGGSPEIVGRKIEREIKKLLKRKEGKS